MSQGNQSIHSVLVVFSKVILDSLKRGSQAALNVFDLGLSKCFLKSNYTNDFQISFCFPMPCIFWQDLWVNINIDLFQFYYNQPIIVYMTCNSIHFFFYLFTLMLIWYDVTHFLHWHPEFQFCSLFKKNKKLLYLVIHQSHHRMCLNLCICEHQYFLKILFIPGRKSSVSWENREVQRGRTKLKEILCWSWSPTRVLIPLPPDHDWAGTKSQMLHWVSQPGTPWYF